MRDICAHVKAPGKERDTIVQTPSGRRDYPISRAYTSMSTACRPARARRAAPRRAVHAHAPCEAAVADGRLHRRRVEADVGRARTDPARAERVVHARRDGSRPAAQGSSADPRRVLDLGGDLEVARRRRVGGRPDRDRRAEDLLAVADQLDAEALEVHDDALGAELQQLRRGDAGDGQVVLALERAHRGLGALVVEARERALVGAEGLEPALELHDVGAARADPEHARGAQALGRVDRERTGLGRRRVAGEVDRRDREPVHALRECCRGSGSVPWPRPRRAAPCRRGRAAQPRRRRARPARSPARRRRASRAASDARAEDRARDRGAGAAACRRRRPCA